MRLFVLIGANQAERANSFTVETHVLGETLAQGDGEALFDKVSDGEGVVLEDTGGEALVSHVEEGKVVLLLEDLAEFNPLFLGQIRAEGVEGGGVEQEGGSVGCGLEQRNERRIGNTSDNLTLTSALKPSHATPTVSGS